LDIQRLLYLTIRGVGTIYVREPPTMTFLSILGRGIDVRDMPTLITLCRTPTMTELSF